MSSRSRQPSINSQTYAIPNPSSTLTHSDEEELSDNSSYQESFNEEESHNQNYESLFDPVTYLHDSIMSAIDVSLEWSSILAKQTQTSGLLKSKYHEVVNLVESSENELNQYKKDFERGVGMLSELMKDLNLVCKKLERLESEFKKEWPVEHQQGRDKVMGIMDVQNDIRDMPYIWKK